NNVQSIVEYFMLFKHSPEKVPWVSVFSKTTINTLKRFGFGRETKNRQLIRTLIREAEESVEEKLWDHSKFDKMLNTFFLLYGMPAEHITNVIHYVSLLGNAKFM